MLGLDAVKSISFSPSHFTSRATSQSVQRWRTSHPEPSYLQYVASSGCYEVSDEIVAALVPPLCPLVSSSAQSRTQRCAAVCFVCSVLSVCLHVHCLFAGATAPAALHGTQPARIPVQASCAAGINIELRRVRSRILSLVAQRSLSLVSAALRDSVLIHCIVFAERSRPNSAVWPMHIHHSLPQQLLACFPFATVGRDVN